MQETSNRRRFRVPNSIAAALGVGQQILGIEFVGSAKAAVAVEAHAKVTNPTPAQVFRESFAVYVQKHGAHQATVLAYDKGTLELDSVVAEAEELVASLEELDELMKKQL